jgi:branched-chain amino acid transport system substrate-binding protein
MIFEDAHWAAPEVRNFYKRHKEVTGVDADYWASPIYYSMLQALTQAIESVGSMDRTAIADYLRKSKFKTLVGEVAMPGQLLDKVYTVGQWQRGFFAAVAGIGYTDFAPVKLKTSWG